MESDLDFASLVAKYILDTYLKREEDLNEIFYIIEDLLIRGDENVKNSIVIGILEDLQNYIKLEGLALCNFEEFLGKETKKWWDDIIRFWANVAIWVESNEKIKRRKNIWILIKILIVLIFLSYFLNFLY